MTYKELIVGERPLPHLISVPAGEPVGGLRPVLCFLHGLREAAPAPIRQALTQHGPLNPDNSYRVIDQFIIVAPQLPAPGGDVWRQRAAEVREIVEAIQAQYYGDPDRTYLTGFSYGGNGVSTLRLSNQIYGQHHGRLTPPVRRIAICRAPCGYAWARLPVANVPILYGQ
jgi:predicted peptidase